MAEEHRTHLSVSRRIGAIDLPIIPTIAALVREVPGTISLGQGVVSYAPPPAAFESLSALADDPLLNRYQSVFGLPALVDALIDKLARDNGIVASPGGSAPAAAPSQIMVAAGSNSALLAAIMAVGDEGDEFILPTPYFFNHEMAVRMCHCRPVLVPTRDNWQLDLAAIEAAITPRTRAIFTVSPNNPTGAVYSPDDLAAVNALCRERGLYHFSDEAYEYFVYGQARHFSPASLPGAADHTLSFYTFSKAFGMASWRVGYVVFPARLAEAMSKVQDTNLICAPVPAQLAALAAMRDDKAWLTPRLQTLSAVRDEALEGLRALDGLAEVPATEGGFYLMVKLPGLGDADPMAFNEAMIRRHQVATIPGFAFGLSDVRSTNYQRLSYGALDAATVRQGIDRFVRAVRHWYDRP